MQIELLETFLDLVETRSFHRSAERLAVTQSTVSARVQVLEAAIGARLFDRSRAGTTLTTEGLKFETHARALRHAWTEAQRAVGQSGTAAMTLRIGMQHDLAAGQIGSWVAAFRRFLPDAAFYLEPDYSAQMCNDLLRGVLDFAVLYSPQPAPDLYFQSIGEVTYRLVSSTATTRAGIDPAGYIRGAYSAAFDMAHSQSVPELSAAVLASGQNLAVVGLLTTLGGSAFVLTESALALTATEKFQMVADVAPISQPVYAGMHLRHRTSGVYGRLGRLVSRRLGPK